MSKDSEVLLTITWNDRKKIDEKYFGDYFKNLMLFKNKFKTTNANQIPKSLG